MILKKKKMSPTTVSHSALNGTAIVRLANSPAAQEIGLKHTRKEDIRNAAGCLVPMPVSLNSGFTDALWADSLSSYHSHGEPRPLVALYTISKADFALLGHLLCLRHHNIKARGTRERQSPGVFSFCARQTANHAVGEGFFFPLHHAQGRVVLGR